MRTSCATLAIACACGSSDGAQEGSGEATSSAVSTHAEVSTQDSGADTSGSTGASMGMGECVLVDPAWSVQVIPVEDRPEAVRLAFSATDAPGIAWTSDYMSLIDQLTYSWPDAGTWAHEGVMGSNPGLGVPGVAFDGAGTPHVLFGWEHSLGGAMSMATRQDDAWAVTMLVAAGASSISSLATRADGSIVGIYQQQWTMDMVAADGMGGWTQSIVDDGTMTNPGGMASAGIGNDLVVDAADVMHTSYYDATDAVFYARGENGTWTRETIATEVGFDTTAIAIDAAGEPHVAYRNEPMQALVLASRDAGSWSSQTIEMGGNGGRAVQLAIDATGVRHVAHFRGEGAELRYAHDADGAFAPVTIAAPIEYAVLALEIDGNDRAWLLWGAGEHLCLAQVP